MLVSRSKNQFRALQNTDKSSDSIRDKVMKCVEESDEYFNKN